MVVAHSLDAARAAAERAKLDLEPTEAILDVQTALAKQAYVQAPSTILRGDPDAALKAAPHKLSAEFSVGGQEHFYLEGQVAFALPGEDGDLIVHSSTQHPTEVQHVCAQVLGCDYNRVTTVVRRLGGGFGGKESNASWVAAAAALAAAKTGRPVKLRLPREIDIIATGKRHGFDYRYTVGFDDEGRVLALDAVLAADAGWSLDMTPGVVARALPCRQRLLASARPRRRLLLPHQQASNTAFRGFGGPQGVLVMEDAIDRIARHLGRDANEIRALNFYGEGRGRDAVRPEGRREPSGALLGRGEAARRLRAPACRDRRLQPGQPGAEARAWPVPAEVRHLLQHPAHEPGGRAGACLYRRLDPPEPRRHRDGAGAVHQGGAGRGRGLQGRHRPHPAVGHLDRRSAQHLADRGLDRLGPQRLGGWEAANTIKQRMIGLRRRAFRRRRGRHRVRRRQRAHRQTGQQPGDELRRDGEALLSAAACRCRRPVSTRRPKVHWDGAAMRGHPFFYFSFGAAVAEVAIDTLTGESRVLRADLVQDCGASLNPAIDLGQIEGAFVQGQGWLTCEELWWDKQGRLRTVGPSTYKIPGSRDVPAVFNVKMLDNAPSREATIFRSKAVGEPPLLLATAVWTALKDAIGAATGNKDCRAPRCAGYARARPRGDRVGTNSRSISAASERSISRRAAFSSLASAIQSAASLKAPASRNVVGSTASASSGRSASIAVTPSRSERTPCGASISRQRCQPSTAGASIR